MSCWEVMISCWVVELSNCLAKNIYISWFTQKRNEISLQQRPELFDCSAENIRLSWTIQKRNESIHQQRPVQIDDEDYWWRLFLSLPRIERAIYLLWINLYLICWNVLLHMSTLCMLAYLKLACNKWPFHLAFLPR